MEINTSQRVKVFRANSKMSQRQLVKEVKVWEPALGIFQSILRLLDKD